MRLTKLLERETDPRPLALVRIVVGLSALCLAVLVERDALQRLASGEVFLAPAFSWLPEPSAGLIDAILLLWIVFAVALTIGLFARPAAAGLAVVAAAAMALDFQAYSNHLALLVALSALLALGSPSAAWSLDARLGRSRAGIPYWPVFLIKLQIATMYGYAAVAKINGTFLGGEVFAARWRPRVTELVEPLGDPFLIAAAILTVLAEGFLAMALWNARLRPVALPLGVGLHLGIVVTIGFGGLPAFGALALGTYVLFPVWRPGSRVVVWDERSGFCGQFVRLFRRLDWFGVHAFVRSGDPRAAVVGDTRAQVDDAIQVVGPDGRSRGFDAVREMLEQSPVTFLFAPVLRAWPLAPLGRRWYRSLASRGRYEIEPVRA